MATIKHTQQLDTSPFFTAFRKMRADARTEHGQFIAEWNARQKGLKVDAHFNATGLQTFATELDKVIVKAQALKTLIESIKVPPIPPGGGGGGGSGPSVTDLQKARALLREIQTISNQANFNPTVQGVTQLREELKVVRDQAKRLQDDLKAQGVPKSDPRMVATSKALKEVQKQIDDLAKKKLELQANVDPAKRAYEKLMGEIDKNNRNIKKITLEVDSRRLSPEQLRAAAQELDRLVAANDRLRQKLTDASNGFKSSQITEGLIRVQTGANQATESLRRLEERARQAGLNIASTMNQASNSALLTGSAGAVSIFKMAQASDKATVSQRLFNKELGRQGIAFEEGNKAIDQLVKTFKTVPSVAEEAVKVMLRNGFTLNDAVKTLTAGAASGLAAGRTVQKSFEAIQNVAVTKLSRELNTIGISGDVGPAMIKYARSIGVTKDELTNLQQAQVIMNVVLKETKQEVEDIPELMQSMAGQISALTSEGLIFIQKFGKTFVPMVTDMLKGATNFLNVMEGFDPTLLKVGAGLFLFGTMSILAFGALAKLGAGISAAQKLAFDYQRFMSGMAGQAMLNKLALAGPWIALAGIVAGTVLAVKGYMEATEKIYEDAEKAEKASRERLASQYGEKFVGLIDQVVVLQEAKGRLLQDLADAEASGNQAAVAAAKTRLSNADALIAKKKEEARAAREAFQAEKDLQLSLENRKAIDESLNQREAELNLDVKTDFGKQAGKIALEFQSMLDEVRQKIPDPTIRIELETRIDRVRQQALDQLVAEQLKSTEQDLRQAEQSIQDRRIALTQDGRTKVMLEQGKTFDEISRKYDEQLAELQKKASEAPDVGTRQKFAVEIQKLTLLKADELKTFTEQGMRAIAEYDLQTERQLLAGAVSALGARRSSLDAAVASLEAFRDKEVELYGQSGDARLRIEGRYSQQILNLRLAAIRVQRDQELLSAQGALEQELRDAQSLGARKGEAEAQARFRFQQEKQRIELASSTQVEQARLGAIRREQEARVAALQDVLGRELRNLKDLTGAELTSLEARLRARRAAASTPGEIKALEDALRQVGQVKLDNVLGLKSALREARDFSRDLGAELSKNLLTGSDRARAEADGPFESQLKNIQKQKESLSKALARVPEGAVSTGVLEQYRAQLTSLNTLELEVLSQRHTARLRAESEYQGRVSETVQGRLQGEARLAEAQGQVLTARRLELQASEEQVRNLESALQTALSTNQQGVDLAALENNLLSARTELYSKQQALQQAIFEDRQASMQYDIDTAEALLDLQRQQAEGSEGQLRVLRAEVQIAEQKLLLARETQRNALQSPSGNIQQVRDANLGVLKAESELLSRKKALQDGFVQSRRDELSGGLVLLEAEASALAARARSDRETVEAKTRKVALAQQELLDSQELLDLMVKGGSSAADVNKQQAEVIGKQTALYESQRDELNAIIELERNRLREGLTLQAALVASQVARAKSDQDVLGAKEAQVDLARAELTAEEGILAAMLKNGASARDLESQRATIVQKRTALESAQQDASKTLLDQQLAALTRGFDVQEASLKLSESQSRTDGEALQVKQKQVLFAERELAAARAAFNLLQQNGATSVELDRQRVEVLSKEQQLNQARSQELAARIQSERGALQGGLALLSAQVQAQNARAVTEQQVLASRQAQVGLAEQELVAAEGVLAFMERQGASSKDIEQQKIEVIGKQTALYEAQKNLLQSTLGVRREQLRAELDLAAALLNRSAASDRSDGNALRVQEGRVQLAERELAASRETLNSVLQTGASSQDVMQARLQVVNAETNLLTARNELEDQVRQREQDRFKASVALQNSNLDLLERQADSEQALLRVKGLRIQGVLQEIQFQDREILLAKARGDSEASINQLVTERNGLYGQLLDRQGELFDLGVELNLLQVEARNAAIAGLAQLSGLADDGVANAYLDVLEAGEQVSRIQKDLQKQDLTFLQRKRLQVDLAKAQTAELQKQEQLQKALEERENLRIALQGKMRDLQNAAGVPLEGVDLATRNLMQAESELALVSAQTAPLLEKVRSGIGLTAQEAQEASGKMDGLIQAINRKREALKGVADAQKAAFTGNSNLLSAISEARKAFQGGELTDSQLRDETRVAEGRLQAALTFLRAAKQTGSPQEQADALQALTKAKQEYDQVLSQADERGLGVSKDVNLLVDAQVAVESVAKSSDQFRFNINDAASRLAQVQSLAEAFTFEIPAENAVTIRDSLSDIQGIIDSLKDTDPLSSFFEALPDRLSELTAGIEVAVRTGMERGLANLKVPEVNGVKPVPVAEGTSRVSQVINTEIHVGDVNIHAYEVNDPEKLAQMAASRTLDLIKSGMAREETLKGNP